jgi:hypothetical protein
MKDGFHRRGAHAAPVFLLDATLAGIWQAPRSGGYARACSTRSVSRSSASEGNGALQFLR